MNLSKLDFGCQVDIQTRTKKIFETVLRELDSIISTAETKVHKTVLAAEDNLVCFRMEFAIRSANTSSTRTPSSIFLLGPRRILLKTEGLTHDRLK